MSSLLPTPEPADPVEGQTGHFEHTNWVKRALKALDQGLLRKPAAGVPAGKILGTSATDTWSPLDPSAIGGVPAGVIVAYNGDTAPAGWAICNGQNGTPDLRDRFIVGVSSSKARGARAGVESVKLTAEQSGVPAHTHVAADVDVPHTHSIRREYWRHAHTILNGGRHVHALDLAQDVSVGGGGKRVTGAGSSNNANTEWAAEHTHGMTEAWATPNDFAPTEASSARHGHPVNANVKADAAQAHDNMPPYYALVYIIKL